MFLSLLFFFFLRLEEESWAAKGKLGTIREGGVGGRTRSTLQDPNCAKLTPKPRRRPAPPQPLTPVGRARPTCCSMPRRRRRRPRGEERSRAGPRTRSTHTGLSPAAGCQPRSIQGAHGARGGVRFVSSKRLQGGLGRGGFAAASLIAPKIHPRMREVTGASRRAPLEEQQHPSFPSPCLHHPPFDGTSEGFAGFKASSSPPNRSTGSIWIPS